MWTKVQNSGVIVDLSDPKPDTLLIEDIAHNLAVESRFNGATNWEYTGGYAYSVAQHSIYVSDMLPSEYRLVGLLHDAPEAYLKDLSTPAKELAGEGYKRLEHIFWLALSRKFNLPGHIPAIVKQVDQRMFATEVRDLCHKNWSYQHIPHEPFDWHVKVWTPKKVKEEFLTRFYALI